MALTHVGLQMQSNLNKKKQCDLCIQRLVGNYFSHSQKFEFFMCAKCEFKFETLQASQNILFS